MSIEKYNHIYSRKINWFTIGSSILAILFMALLLLQLSNNLVTILILGIIIGILIFSFLLNIADWLYYRLYLSEESIVERKLFNKKRNYKYSDINKFRISLDKNSIFLSGDKIDVSLRDLNHADELISHLSKTLGRDKLEL